MAAAHPAPSTAEGMRGKGKDVGVGVPPEEGAVRAQQTAAAAATAAAAGAMDLLPGGGVGGSRHSALQQHFDYFDM
jgi:hypothetical protein